MDLSAVFSVVFANILVWGLILGVTFHATRRARKRASEPPPGLPPIEREGFEFSRRRYLRPRTKTDNETWVEYGVSLPGPLGALGLVDADALLIRTTKMGPREEIETMGSPQTADSAFDGQFELTAPWTEELSAALGDPEVRALLVRARDAFGGLWIDAGRLRVVEREADSDADVSVDSLVALVVQLRERTS